MRVPDCPARWRQELDLQGILAGAINASIGAAVPEAGRAYDRARALCEKLGDTSALIPVLGGLGARYVQRGELDAFHQIAEHVLRLGIEDKNAACLGHRQMGLCMLARGEFRQAREHLECVLALYVPETNQSTNVLIGFDGRASALSYLPWVLFILGYPDQALSRSREALSWARAFGRPHLLMNPLAMASTYHLIRRADTMAVEILEEFVALTAEQRNPLWLSFAQSLYGCVVAMRGKPMEGLALSRKGLAALEAITGVGIFRPIQLGVLAQTCESVGHYDEALEIVASALVIVERTGERNYEAELHRQRGEWLLAHRGGEQPESEACLCRAVAVAREQSARMWELRASTSLARLWLTQGKRTEAHDLLAPIYGWFTEGFDTPDLKEAKGLLEELG